MQGFVSASNGSPSISIVRPAANGSSWPTGGDRGRPRATLGPLAGGDHIARGVDEGWITLPAKAGPPPPRPHRVRTKATIAEMLAEDRGEW